MKSMVMALVFSMLAIATHAKDNSSFKQYSEFVIASPILQTFLQEDQKLTGVTAELELRSVGVQSEPFTRDRYFVILKYSNEWCSFSYLATLQVYTESMRIVGVAADGFECE